MQDDIKRSLDKNLEQLLEASEKKNSGGVRVLRVVAVGKSSDVPVRWVYAHLSDDSGSPRLAGVHHERRSIRGLRHVRRTDALQFRIATR